MSEPWWTLARWGIVAALAVLAVFIGDPLVRRIFHLAGEVPDPEPAETAADSPLEPTEDAAAVAAGADLGEAGPLRPPPSPGVEEESLTLVEAAGARLRGGRAIGWLERLATYATLLAAFPAGIAVVVAVKGLARYPDLKASDGTAERFILGTFTSLLVASAAAGVAYWLIGLLPLG